MQNHILGIVFIILFFLPVVFQLFYGAKVLKKSTKLKLWQVSLISLIGQVLITSVNLALMSFFIKQAESHDGLPMVGVVFMSIITTGLILLVVLIQTVVAFKSIKQ